MGLGAECSAGLAHHEFHEVQFYRFSLPLPETLPAEGAGPSELGFSPAAPRVSEQVTGMVLSLSLSPTP